MGAWRGVTFSLDFSTAGACATAGVVSCTGTFLLRSSSCWALMPVVWACVVAMFGVLLLAAAALDNFRAPMCKRGEEEDGFYYND